MSAYQALYRRPTGAQTYADTCARHLLHHANAYAGVHGPMLAAIRGWRRLRRRQNPNVWRLCRRPGTAERTWRLHPSLLTATFVTFDGNVCHFWRQRPSGITLTSVTLDVGVGQEASSCRTSDGLCYPRLHPCTRPCRTRVTACVPWPRMWVSSCSCPSTIFTVFTPTHDCHTWDGPYTRTTNLAR